MIRLFICCFVLLLASCAQVVTPAGGPIDNIPPAAVKYNPDSAARNIRPSKIEIQFNEYVQLKDLPKNLVVSPSLKHPADVTASNKTITVKLKDTLEDNTTYIIDFGKAITDITEANAKEFKYVFSTGPFIDTMKFFGTVENALTKEREADFMVFLYRNMSDSTPYKEKPYYYTRADKTGNFNFTNIKPGTYRLFALKDGNSNFIPDQGEAIAFASEPVEVNGKTSGDLKSFIEEPFKTIIKKPEIPLPGKILVSYNRPVKNIDVVFPDPKKSVTVVSKERSRNNDSLAVWYKDATSDSVVFIAVTEATRDTIEKKLPTIKQMKGGNPYKISSSSIDAQNAIKGKSVTFETTAPLTKIDTSKISVTTYKTSHPFIIKLDSLYQRTFKLTHLIVEDTVYKVTMLPGALKFFNGEVNDTITVQYRRRPSKAYGSVDLKLKNPPASGILQLLTEKGDIRSVMQIRKGTNYDMIVDELEPGSYSARFIEDINENKKWDTGNYLKKTQPENVIYFSKKLQVKASWEVEETWDMK
jgi:uncharacterized protein (DUF2141 family)